MYYNWKPYVPVAQRRANALRTISKLKALGHPVAPVQVKGRQIAHSFWGKAWCENLENYSDFDNRLPRGRTYVRNGSVIDLQISAGAVDALVSGSEIYKVAIKVPRLASRQWVSICDDCGSSVKSLVELLQGRLSDGVMERVCRSETGLFPEPSHIEFKCSCPDWASMCKHVAAVLYGVGVRLDKQPELLFRLRDVDEQELIENTDRKLALGAPSAPDRALGHENLAEMFGIELAVPREDGPQRAARRRARGEKPVSVGTLSHSPRRKKTAANKPAVKRRRASKKAVRKRAAPSKNTRREAKARPKASDA